MAYIAPRSYFRRYENEGNNEMYMFNNITNDCSNQVSNLQCKTLWYGIYTNVANIRRFINISNHRIFEVKIESNTKSGIGYMVEPK